MKQIIAIAVFPNNIELRLDAVEANDLTMWLSSPERASFVEIDGTIIRQEPLLFMGYPQWLESKGMHVCDRGVEHRGRCDCYRPINMPSENSAELSALGPQKIIERSGKSGQKIIMESIKRKNPNLHKHLENGGTFSTYQPELKGRGWKNGHWTFERHYGLQEKEDTTTRVHVIDTSVVERVERIRKAQKARQELGVLPSKVEEILEEKNPVFSEPKKTETVVTPPVKDDLDDIFGLPDYLTQ